MAVKKEKMNGILQRELTDIISKEVKNPQVGFITITGVEVTGDFSLAKVYVTFLGQGYRKKHGLEALEKSKGFIRSMLASRLTIRRVPELKFIYDSSLDYGDKIESLIKEIHENDDPQAED